MKRKRILGIVRHALTFLGGALVASGKLDAATSEAVAGGLMTVIGGLWSVFAPEKKD